MGLFTSKLKVWNPAAPERVEEVELWVDTGASYSWISRARLEPLGIRPTRRRQFRTIEGKFLDRDMAPVFVEAEGFVGGDNVVFAEAGDAEVMGAYTLECLGLAADVVEKKLVPTVGMALTVPQGPMKRGD